MDYYSVGGSATEGTDYGSASGSLQFAAGQTQQTIGIGTYDDSLYESDEYFSVYLTNAGVPAGR